METTLIVGDQVAGGTRNNSVAPAGAKTFVVPLLLLLLLPKLLKFQQESFWWLQLGQTASLDHLKAALFFSTNKVYVFVNMTSFLHTLSSLMIPKLQFWDNFPGWLVFSGSKPLFGPRFFINAKALILCSPRSNMVFFLVWSIIFALPIASRCMQQRRVW